MIGHWKRMFALAQIITSRQDVLHDMAVDVGEAEVSAGVAVGELFVIETHEVENGGVEVVDVDFVFDGCEAEFVGGAVGHAAFDTATGQPDGEAVVVVVATIGTFGDGSPAEFTAPEDESVFKESAGF